jgi:hypothetical protein
MKGIASVLCHFEHEQYPSNSVNPWCLITKYSNEDIGFLVCFGRVTQSPCMCQKICDRAQCIFAIPWEGYCMFIESFTHK